MKGKLFFFVQRTNIFLVEVEVEKFLNSGVPSGILEAPGIGLFRGIVVIGKYIPNLNLIVDPYQIFF